MAIREHQLIYCHNSEPRGWLEHNAPDYFTPGDFTTAAHDLLEHPPGLTGPAAEIAAFGAIIFGRYEGAYEAISGKRFTNPTSMGMELHDLILGEDYDFFLSDLPDPTESYELMDIPLDAIADSDDLEVMVSKFATYVSYDSEEELHRAKAWANLGYLWAKKQYGNSHALAELFFDLENKVKAFESSHSEQQRVDVIITTEPGSPLHAEVKLWEGYHPEEETFYMLGEPDNDEEDL